MHLYCAILLSVLLCGGTLSSAETLRCPMDVTGFDRSVSLNRPDLFALLRADMGTDAVWTEEEEEALTRTDPSVLRVTLRFSGLTQATIDTLLDQAPRGGRCTLIAPETPLVPPRAPRREGGVITYDHEDPTRTPIRRTRPQTTRALPAFLPWLARLFTLPGASAQAAFPVSSVPKDDCNRTESPLVHGTDWIGDLDTSDTGVWEANGTHCLRGAGSSLQGWVWGTPFPPSIDVWAKLGALPADNNDMRLHFGNVEVGTDNPDGYRVHLLKQAGAGNDLFRFYRIDNSVSTQVGTSVTQEFVANDGLGARFIAGVAELFYWNGSTWTSMGTRGPDLTYPAGGYMALNANSAVVTVNEVGINALPAGKQRRYVW